MTNKFVTISKYLILGVGVLIGTLSCENDFENIGVDVVDNDVFTSEKHTSEVIAYNSNVAQNQTNNLKNQLLGVFHHENFGKLTASFVTQLTIPATDPDFGEQAIIDTVILDIPYSKENLWKSTSGEVNLEVQELGTFLHYLDPEEPTKVKEYYSNSIFTSGVSLYNGTISPSENDTLLLVNRYHYEDISDLTTFEVNKIDTLETDNPSIKIGLSEDFFKTNFIDMADGSEFASQANFNHHFKGLIIKAMESVSGEGSLVKTDLEGATVTIYYNKITTEDEDSDEDLDGDGILGETGVTVQTSSKATYRLTQTNTQTNTSQVKVNLYERDYASAAIETYLTSPNVVAGDDKLFLQGAIGSNATIKLFGEDTDANGIPDELEELRTKEWLINDAQLTFYVDESNVSDDTVQGIYIYTIGEDGNEQVFKADDATNKMSAILVKDDDVPTKYTIHLTDYITEIIKPDTELELRDFGIKVFEPTDLLLYSPEKISKKSSEFKGVVLKGNNLDAADAKRLKLEIYYSEKND